MPTLQTLTVGEAIRRFPDLLAEPVTIVSHRPVGWNQNTRAIVTLQFTGDGNYRTRGLYEQEAPATPVMNDSTLLKKIANRIHGMNRSDCTTLEKQIVQLMSAAGYLRVEMNGDIVLGEKGEF